MRKILKISMIALLVFTTGCGEQYDVKSEKENIKVYETGKNSTGDLRYAITTPDLNTLVYGDYYFEADFSREIVRLKKRLSFNAHLNAKEYKIKVYDFKTKKMIKTIDVLKKAKKHVDMEKYQFNYFISFTQTKREGHDCLIVQMEKRPTQKELEDEKVPERGPTFNLYIGIEDDYVSFDEKEAPYIARDYWKPADIVTLADMRLNNISYKDGKFDGSPSFSYNGYWEGSEEDICIISVGIGDLEFFADSEIRLFKEFPELRKYIGKKKDKDKMLRIYMKSRDWKELISLFMREGQEPKIENVLMKHFNSKDGEEHIINSEEEYYMYAKETLGVDD